MYFDIKPKKRGEDLFGSDYLVRSLLAYLNQPTVRLIVVKGLRRTGKTSLLNVVINNLKGNALKIDVREAPFYDRKECMNYIIERIKNHVGESLFEKIVKKISGISLSYENITTTLHLENESSFSLFFQELNNTYKNKKEFFVLAFDEVQLLEKIQFHYLFAAIYDNYSHIKMIFSGSEIGLLDAFLGKRDAKSPLFGRAIIEIETKRLTSEQVHSFLTLGFTQIKKEIKLIEIKEVIENLDGIIGWATHYGWLRTNNESHQIALKKVIEEGTVLVKNEFDMFAEKRNKAVYLIILKLINNNYNHWSLLKKQFIKQKRKISDRQLAFFIKELIDYSFIEKTNDVYNISDPLLARAI